MILKGQNVRILKEDDGKFKCIAMATRCTVTLTGNTEEAASKDDVGMAQKPTIVSQGWSMSVDSLDVSDTQAMLAAIKSVTPFTLVWDETSTTNNQEGVGASFHRMGRAFLTDATFQFDDRTNSTKSLQFSGSGPLSQDSHLTYEQVSAAAYTKGQFVRLFLSSDGTAVPSKVIAAAKTLQLHVGMTTEDSTTKDTEGQWQSLEPTGLSYDISTSALVRGNDVITSPVNAQDLAAVEAIYEAGQPVKWQIASVSGDNQRTKGTVIASGDAVLTQLTITAQNRSNATYEAKLSGYGAYDA